MFGVHPDIEPHKQKGRLERIDELWINVRTLYRNTVGAVASTVDKRELRTDDVAVVMAEEMRVIPAIVDERSQGKVRVRFYFCEYKRLAKEFPKASLYRPKTDLQTWEKFHEEQVVAHLLTNPGVKPMIGITEWKVTPAMFGIPPSRVAMLTSYPLDLLQRYEFTDLYLLESHTGKFKHTPEFHTKLKTKPKDVPAPLNLFTLQIYGDNGRIFDPNPKPIRDHVTALARRDAWSFASSIDRLKMSIEKHHDRVLVQLLKAMF